MTVSGHPGQRVLVWGNLGKRASKNETGRCVDATGAALLRHFAPLLQLKDAEIARFSTASCSKISG
jgi:hypothetical protein